MSKFFKRALGLAAVGGAVAAGVAYYLKKEDNSDDFLDEFDDDFATEDSDYVIKNKSAILKKYNDIFTDILSKK